MAWSLVQSFSNIGSADVTTFTVTAGSNLSSGTKLIAVVNDIQPGNVPTAIDDGNSNNFTKVADSGVPSGGSGGVQLWVLDTPAGDVGTKPTFTAHAAGGTVNGWIILIQEVSGLATGTTGSLDGTAGTLNNQNSSTGTGNFSSGNPSYSSTAANEYLVSAASIIFNTFNAGNTAVPTSLTADAHNLTGGGFETNGGIGYGNSTNGTESGAWTFNSAAANQYAGWGVILVAFKLAGGAAAPAGTVQPVSTFRTPRRKPGRAVTGFTPVATVNTGHGPAGTVQPVTALPAPRRKPARAAVQFVPVRTVNSIPGGAGTVQSPATLPAPRRKPARAVVQFVPVRTVNTGHGPAGTIQPLATFPTPRRKPSRGQSGFIPVTTFNATVGPAGKVQPRGVPGVMPRRKPSRGGSGFVPVVTVNNPNPVSGGGTGAVERHHRRGRGR